MIALNNMEDVKTMLAGLDDDADIDYSDFGPAQDAAWPSALGGKSKTPLDAAIRDSKNRVEAATRALEKQNKYGSWVIMNRPDLNPIGAMSVKRTKASNVAVPSMVFQEAILAGATYEDAAIRAVGPNAVLIVPDANTVKKWAARGIRWGGTVPAAMAPAGMPAGYAQPASLPVRQFTAAPAAPVAQAAPQAPTNTGSGDPYAYPAKPLPAPIEQPVQDDPFFTRQTPNRSIPMPMGVPSEVEADGFSTAPTFDTPAQGADDNRFFDDGDPYAGSNDSGDAFGVPDGFGTEDLGGGFFGKIFKLAAPVAGGIFGGPAGAAAGMAVSGALSKQKKPKAPNAAAMAQQAATSSPNPNARASGSGGAVLLGVVAVGGLAVLLLTRKRK